MVFDIINTELFFLRLADVSAPGTCSWKLLGSYLESLTTFNVSLKILSNKTPDAEYPETPNNLRISFFEALNVVTSDVIGSSTKLTSLKKAV